MPRLHPPRAPSPASCRDSLSASTSSASRYCRQPREPRARRRPQELVRWRQDDTWTFGTQPPCYLMWMTMLPPFRALSVKLFVDRLLPVSVSDSASPELLDGRPLSVAFAMKS